MDIFVEDIDGDFAVCRLPDHDKNIIRLPLRKLPEGVKQFSVITQKTNGIMFLNEFGKEVRREKIIKHLKYNKYYPEFTDNI